MAGREKDAKDGTSKRAKTRLKSVFPLILRLLMRAGFTAVCVPAQYEFVESLRRFQINIRVTPANLCASSPHGA
jgi:hypothetical protein